MLFKNYIAVAVLAISLLSISQQNSLAGSDFPARPIELYIGYSPGGLMDLVCRFYSDKWRETLGQPVIIVNKAGAGGTIAGKYVADSKPDGYTLFAGSDSTLITAPLLQKDIGYTLDSFESLFEYSSITMTFITSGDSKFRNMKDFLDDAKKRSGKITYASWGTGVTGHLTASMLFHEAGVDVIHIPYKSTPEVIAAVLGGHIGIAVTAGTPGYVGSPRIKILAIADEKRNPNFLGIPTLKELGYDVVLSAIATLDIPRGAPRNVVEKLINAHKNAVAKYEDKAKEFIGKTGGTMYNKYGVDVEKEYRSRIMLYKKYAPIMGVKIE